MRTYARSFAHVYARVFALACVLFHSVVFAFLGLALRVMSRMAGNGRASGVASREIFNTNCIINSGTNQVFTSTGIINILV